MLRMKLSYVCTWPAMKIISNKQGPLQTLKLYSFLRQLKTSPIFSVTPESIRCPSPAAARVTSSETIYVFMLRRVSSCTDMREAESYPLPLLRLWSTNFPKLGFNDSNRSDIPYCSPPSLFPSIARLEQISLARDIYHNSDGTQLFSRAHCKQYTDIFGRPGTIYLSIYKCNPSFNIVQMKPSFDASPTSVFNIRVAARDFIELSITFLAAMEFVRRIRCPLLQD